MQKRRRTQPQASGAAADEPLRAVAESALGHSTRYENGGVEADDAIHFGYD